MTTYSSAPQRRGRSQRRGESRRTGQWKLAYADFLTALMAFFLLMWLATGSSQAERAAIASYFSGQEAPISEALPAISYADLETRLASQIEANTAFIGLEDHIQFHADPAGLRINLIDASARSLFNSGSTALSETGAKIVGNMGTLIGPLPVNIRVEGHTDAFKTAPGTQSNWEISSGRANHALTLLQASGITSNRFTSVSGLAATKPLLVNQPHAPINRRISIVLELSE